jgi:bacterial/archaeal transporter family-2 protein
MKNPVMNHSTWFALLTLPVGFCLPVMASANGALGKSLGSPFTATLGVFLLASALIAVVIMVSHSPGLNLTNVAGTNWKMWLGGFIVVMNIITFTIVPQKIGASKMIILLIAGQMISSVAARTFWVAEFSGSYDQLAADGRIAADNRGVILVKKY